MKKAANQKLFLSITFFSFVIMVLISIAYGSAISENSWYMDLISIRLLYIPYLVYLIGFAIIIGLIVTTIIYFMNQKEFLQIENELQYLAEGNYESTIFEQRKLDLETSSVYQEDIERHILSLHDKLVELSKEVQINGNQPILVDGETKEEILTQERHRLARELHDSVSQQLFAAMMMLSALNEQAAANSNEIFQKQLKMVESIINESQSEMRALLLHLRPISLEGKTLRKGIEQLLIELKSKVQIQLKWEVDDVYLPNGVEDHLFRIVQELLSNTLRHSKAKELEVYLKQIDQLVLLKVIDDGVGFDTNETKAGNYGLQNIKERVAGMGGTCKFISFPGKGTSIEIKIPIIKGSGLDD
ncbi:sensor histidine kinase [Carnobacterium gallinarum]|uniref:sensor histidine kinase n=1 Tax=Carnobacterium gallinarum TaxID=2749 RepID=UPI00054D8C8C|nr:sensor histidine kinase [Carnobacterium gallinarum]